MDWLVGVKWEDAIVPDTALIEIFLRGSIVYLAIYFLLRGVLKRQAGGMGLSDVLVIVLIADAAQNAMAGEYTSVPDGLLLVLTIVFWSYTLDWLGFHFRGLEPIIFPQSIVIVRDGRMLRKRMQRELVSEEELMAQLRLQGISNLADVSEARIERDGRMSIVTKSDSAEQAQGAQEKQTT
ncbi:MAG: YetF domain-containing protein [Thermomicrobiales bacterium]